jgi:threonine dehydrogenase-like Zn-dependent dehydrogenase
VIIAAEEMPRFFPMLMTAACTIPPAQVLVLGAGVAGLQAIATARRLGAVVTAFDVRSAVKEQIQSLGARFFEVEGGARRRGHRRVRARTDARGTGDAARGADGSDGQVGRDHHDGAGAGPPGAEADLGRGGGGHEARQAVARLGHRNVIDAQRLGEVMNDGGLHGAFLHR